jgi:PAS domain S-box-containing protein
MPVEQRLSQQEQEAFTALGRALRAASPSSPSLKSRKTLDFPEFVRAALDRMPGANLFVQKGELDYATPAAAAMLGFPNPEELLDSVEIAREIKALPGTATAAELTSAKGSPVTVAIERTAIAWRNGPAERLTLTLRGDLPAPAGEPEAATKEPTATTKEAPAATVLAPLPAPSEQPVTPPAPHPPVVSVPPLQPSASLPEPSEPVVADQELRAILDTASDGIVTLDGDGRIMSFSAGAEAIFGLTSAEVKGRALTELMSPDSRKTVREYLAALQGPGLASVFNDGREVTAVVSQGGEVPLFLTIGKLQRTKPGQAALCAVVRDITQWKKTEAELREARDEAERQSRLKSEFLANVSHELRTPLNAILGFSEMMRMQSFGEIENEKYRSYVNDIHSSGSHLLSLINDLLDLSKVEAGKLELNFTAVNLAEVTEHAMTLVAGQAAERRVLLRKNIPPGLPQVVADLRSMRQILLNLLSNAVKFTDPGGQAIVSAALTKEGELKLKVKDTGLGMSDAELAHALEPFRRVATEGREAEGTGLGLPLTKALAEANRTSFAITSAPGKGTTVEITFPTTRVLAA